MPQFLQRYLVVFLVLVVALAVVRAESVVLVLWAGLMGADGAYTLGLRKIDERG